MILAIGKAPSPQIIVKSHLDRNVHTGTEKMGKEKIGIEQNPHAPHAQSLQELQPLHRMCREGRVYDVEQWIKDGKPLQLAPGANEKGRRLITAMQIALESGQHSLTLLLLRGGYRLDQEQAAALDTVLEKRRWDLFELLLEWGADLSSAGPYSILNTYSTDLYERYFAAGYDLTKGHEMGAILGLGTSNRPLLRFRQAA